MAQLYLMFSSYSLRHDDPLPLTSKFVFYGTSLLLSSRDDRASDGITTSANLYATSDLTRRYHRGSAHLSCKDGQYVETYYLCVLQIRALWVMITARNIPSYKIVSLHVAAKSILLFEMARSGGDSMIS
ncbi:hypothetical protein M405DRAFT_939211 [Rhizopogon salebrosus TDB-379]|nr:hypothetical protein M405DRAFT_939211 [Rhizopogon salebrosus TDB-379]